MRGFRVLSPLWLLLLAYIIVVIPALSVYYYHPDELMHIDIASGPSLAKVYNRGLRELHPPGVHFIRYFLLLFDKSLTTQRLLSIVPGGLSVVIAYLIGLKAAGRTAALTLATSQAFSQFTITYSFSIRNYSLFLSALYVSSLSFDSLAKSLTLRKVIVFCLFSLASCTFHYAGFIYSFCMLLALLLYRAILDMRLSSRLLLCGTIIGLPHLALGLFFYKTHISSGRNGGAWVDYIRDEAPSSLFQVTFDQIFLNAKYMFTSFYGLSSIYSPLLALIILFGLIGGVVIFKSALAYLGLIVIIVQSGLAIVGFYPLSGARYNTFLFIPLTLGLGFCAAFFERVLPRNFRLLRSTAYLVTLLLFSLHAIVAAYTNSYFRLNYETPLSFSNWQRFLEEFKNIKTDEVLLTNKLDGLYLNSHFSPQETAYRNVSLEAKNYGGKRVFFQSKAHRWNYEFLEDFTAFVEELRLDHGFVESNFPKQVWLSAIGLTDFVINSIHDCATEEGWVLADLSTEDFLLFKVPSVHILGDDSLKALSTAKCFEKSRFLHLAQLQRLYYLDDTTKKGS